MIYEKLAELIEAHNAVISREVAQKAIASHLAAYADLNLDIFTQQIQPTIAMVSRYARTGEPDEFRDYIIAMTERRMREERNMEDVLDLTFIMCECVKEVVVRELPGEANKTLRERFTTRLDSMYTFSTITVNATRRQIKSPARESTGR